MSKGMVTVAAVALAMAFLPVLVQGAIYVNAAWVGTPPGTDPDGPFGPATSFGLDSFATIQDGVNGAVPGEYLVVYAGTYMENVVVPKALNLWGPNFGKAGNDPTRGAEAVLMPAMNNPDDSTLVSFEANNIVMDGFLFDGDNPSLAGGYAVGAADVNVSAGIQNGSSILSLVSVKNITVQNSVFRNLSYQGVYFAVPSGWNSSGNFISNNKFDTMWEGVQLNGMHARIEGNYFSSVGTGLGVHTAASACDSGFVPIIQNNTVNIGPETVWNPLCNRAVGIWVNDRWDQAPALSVAANVVNTPLAAVGLIIGFQVDSFAGGRTVTFSNNTVNGSGNCDVGLEALNCSSDSGVTVSGGSLAGLNDAGVRALTTGAVSRPAVLAAGFAGGSPSRLDNTDVRSLSGNALSPPARPLGMRDWRTWPNPGGAIITNPVHLAVDNVAISEVALGAGLDIANPTTDAGLTAALTLQGATQVSNSLTGIALTGQGASVTFAGASPAAQLDNVTSYIVQAGNGTTVPNGPINCTKVAFDGKTGAAMTPSELFAAEDKVAHKVDDNSLGLVTWRANNLYVTPTVGDVQNGVDATPGGHILNVQGGGYSGGVNAAGALTLAPGTPNGTAQATLAGDLTLGSSGTFAVEINGAAAGAQYDQWVVNGAVDLGGAALSATRTAEIPRGTDIILIANDGADGVVGTFGGLPQAAPIDLGGRSFVVYYTGGDGNDVVLRMPSMNTAPTLADTVVEMSETEVTPLPEGAVGTLVSQLVDLVGGGGQNNVTDPNMGAVTGMAVIGADTTHGAWYFTTDGGANWNLLGPVSGASARLLAADALTRVYFVSNPDFRYGIPEALTFRAWDQFVGANGEAGVETGFNGYDTPFSAATDTVSLWINKWSTATAITTHTPNPSSDGEAVSVSFTVTYLNGAPPGNVTVSDGTASCTAPVTAGDCSLTLVGAGGRTLTATYPGYPGFFPSVSEGVPHTVNPAASPVGRAPDGVSGTPLRISKNLPQLDLTWGASCGAAATDFAVYEGTLGSWYGHTSLVCSTAGAQSATVAPSSGDRYYLVVPVSATQEGSYGTRSTGAEIPQSSSPCRVSQDLSACL